MIDNSSVKFYLVGGAVRDHILGREAKDRDYVVVGADVDWMLSQGFKQVGQAFPVFLHPETGEEYALARREKKVAPGYKGFEFEFGPHVTLEDDLIRRDLTINAMALSTNDQIIDPFGGCQDLDAGIIRHTSEAFAEDPLRVLRVARFAARYGFKVDPSTVELCKKLVDAGEIDALSNDRIWSELTKLFTEGKASTGIKFLIEVGAHKTQMLMHLISEPIDFVSIYGNTPVEESLTPDERMFLILEIAGLDNKKAEEFRIPADLRRKINFFDAVHWDLMSSFMFSGVIEAVRVVEIFNAFRVEFARGDLSDVKNFVGKLAKNEPDVDKFFYLMERSIAALLAQDFTEFVKTVPPKEIKKAVLAEKIKAVNEVLSKT